MLIRLLINFLTMCLLTLGVAGYSYAVDLDASIYGKLNLSYDFLDQDVNDWHSNASRLGIKGKSSLSDNYALIYQLEQEVDAAHGGTNKDTLLKTRNSFIGVEGGIGQIIFGSHDTPSKKIQSKIDLFNDQAGDIKTLFVGEVRARDSYQYSSPKFGNGFKFKAMYVPDDSNFDASQSYALSFAKDKLFAALSFDSGMRKNDRTVSKTKVYDTIRAAIQYKPENWQLGAILQNSEQKNSLTADKEFGYVLSANYKYDALVFKVQLGRSNITASNRKNLQFGIDYKFMKNSKVYLNYFKQDDDLSDTRIVSVGIELKF